MGFSSIISVETLFNDNFTWFFDFFLFFDEIKFDIEDLCLTLFSKEFSNNYSYYFYIFINASDFNC